MSARAGRVVVLAGAVAFCASVRAAELPDPSVAPLAPGAPPAPAVARAASPLPESLALVWIDLGVAAVGSERAAREEATRLLREMGVSATWRGGDPGETAQPGELRVILLNRAAVDRSGSPVLGSTPSRFEGEPFFWVHVPSVQGALGLDPRRRLGPADLRDRHALGVALGRVIAHEIVHAVAPDIPHGAGLMSPRLKKADLTARTLAVPAHLGRALRAALADGDSTPQPDAAPGDTRLLTVGAEGVERPR